VDASGTVILEKVVRQSGYPGLLRKSTGPRTKSTCSCLRGAESAEENVSMRYM
jgi:hypothetical protein